MNFSIIIPVYNVEKYLTKCLDSVINQTYKKFEIILINDGSTDGSSLICKKYVQNDVRIKYLEQKNSGLSVARNNGVLHAKGDYLLFLDSDDYLEPNLLEVLNKELDKKYDLIRFQVQYDKDGVKYQTKGTNNTVVFNNGIDAFNEIVNYEIVEAACCYLYNKNFFIKNKFKFKKNTVHEDFGLIPLVIIKSQYVKCIDYVGYNYVMRDNSIMNNNSYDAVLKKTNDLLIHFKNLLSESSDVVGDLSVFKSFIANSVLLKVTTLKKNDYKVYLKYLKKMNVFSMLLDDTFSRKMKKNIIKISPKLYYKLIGGLK